MAASVPIVATSVGGVMDAVTDGVTGILVPLGDAAALSDALGKLEANSALRAQLAAVGNQVAHAKFSQEIVIETLSSIYEMLAGRHPAPTSTYVNA